MSQTIERVSSGEPAVGPQITLVDLLDRLLGTGVVLSGDIVISLSGVDLVEIKLNALITTVRDQAETMTQSGARR